LGVRSRSDLAADVTKKQDAMHIYPEEVTKEFSQHEEIMPLYGMNKQVSRNGDFHFRLLEFNNLMTKNRRVT
jgi:hypothetical protein